MTHIFDFLDATFKEWFEERSAICEYDAYMGREEAERMAMEELNKRRAAVDADKVVNK